jgi:putative hydrolase of the HAD superfamily
VTLADSLDALFLDAGGVLVHPNWNRVSDALARRGVHAPAAALAAAEPYAKLEIDRGEIVAGTDDHGRGWLYFNKVLRLAGVTLSEATAAALEELHVYHATDNLWETVSNDAEDALARFREAGLRLTVVSNANGRLHHLLGRLNLSHWFDVAIDSFEEGVEKPDPRLFHIALARTGAPADRVMHVGDLYHIDVVGARAAGLRAALIDPAGLYPQADCLRASSLTDLADRLAEN